MESFLSKRYLMYRFFSNMFFIGVVWLFFYRIFITDQQVGLLDGMSFAVGLIAEVPAGALADRFGRDRIVKLGQILVGLGLILQGFGSSFFPFFFGQSIIMVGAAFASGADDALFFQRLNYNSNSPQWRKLATRGRQVALIGSVIALTVGGLLYQINPRIPWIVSGISFIISSVIVWSIKDTRERAVNKSFASETKDYIGNILEGFRQFRKPQFFLYLPLIVIVQGLFYADGWGLLRPILLSRFNFGPTLGSWALASVAVLTVGLLHLMHKYAERLSEKNVLAFISFTAAISLILSIFHIGFWGYIIIFILYAGENSMYTFMSEILNNKASEDQRATVLSVATFMRMFPYVILAPIIGYLSTHKHLEYFFIVWGVLMLLATFYYLIRQKEDSVVTVESNI